MELNSVNYEFKNEEKNLNTMNLSIQTEIVRRTVGKRIEYKDLHPPTMKKKESESKKVFQIQKKEIKTWIYCGIISIFSIILFPGVIGLFIPLILLFGVIIEKNHPHFKYKRGAKLRQHYKTPEEIRNSIFQPKLNYFL